MENNSKQAILSIVGIAILVIAVVGVSFAFFTYSKSGTKNNVITTGKISFVYEEDANNLEITKEFPMSDDEGKGRIDTEEYNFEFHVTGTAPTGSPISYNVYVVPGETSGSKVRMKYSEIGLALKSEDGGQVEEAFDAAGSGTYRLSAEPSGTNTKVASGQITSSTAETTHNYKLTMWVNESVTISDTDANATYRASEEANGGANTGKEVYSNLYYSLKVNVTANA